METRLRRRKTNFLQLPLCTLNLLSFDIFVTKYGTIVYKVGGIEPVAEDNWPDAAKSCLTFFRSKLLNDETILSFFFNCAGIPIFIIVWSIMEKRLFNYFMIGKLKFDDIFVVKLGMEIYLWKI